VGLRTVFRHFDDMETLYREITLRLDELMLPLVHKPLKATLWTERLVESIERRCAIFDRLAPYHIAAQLHMHDSEYILQQVKRRVKIEQDSLAWLLPARFTADIALVAPFAGGLPPLTALSFDLDDVLRLLPAAVACGMLGLVTSLSIARALAVKSHQFLDANQEVRAQGLSNMLGPWFSASLSAGSFTRSALNLQAGARTPLAGVFSALLVALFAVFGAALLTHIPLPVMAAGILLICWGLVDLPAIRALRRVSRSEFMVMLLTFAATASGMALFGVGSAFWGLAVGFIALAARRWIGAR
jgi:hypothetical protein